MPRKKMSVRAARAARGATPKKKPSYTKKAVDAAYREVQGKMRKEVTKLQKITSPLRLKRDSHVPGSDRDTMFSIGIKKIQDIGMKGRSSRTKAISAASKKHGVPKSQITAKKPINPGEIASKKAREWKKKFGM